MKKLIISTLILSLALAAVSGCAKGMIHAAPDEIVIALDISDVSDTIYAADIGYSLNGKLVGSLGCCNANGSPLKDTVRFALTENMLPENSTTDHFSYNVTLYGDKESMNGGYSDRIKTTDESRAFTPSYGMIYRTSLTGSFEDGFTLDNKKVMPGGNN